VNPLEAIGRHGVLPVVVLHDADWAVPVGEALAAGGLPLVEVTFRTPAAAEAIRRLAGFLPDLLVGAGTVTSVDQAEAATAAGARFLVSPGLSGTVVRWALAADIPIIPGIQTATEVMAAIDLGLGVLKFFPAAASGGPAAVAAMGGPFPDISLVPTGGVRPTDLATYLRLPNVLACGGTWLAPPDVVAAGDLGRVSQLAAEATRIADEARR
jgi:2-dehydro-3-deoxyphosphogluconate aldolase/(4S)-4-hydroxy-2-oxoglutarate aldolase